MTLVIEPENTDCRSRLIRAATEIFVQEGYRASIDRVAARAGVARQTLYNHFTTKADLFGEVVRQSTASLLFSLDDEGLALRERLLRFGIEYRGRVLSSEGLGFFRALAAESIRFPELAAAFYRNGAVQTAACLGKILEAAMLRGELRRDEPEFATNMLLSMLVGTDRSRYLFSGELSPEINSAHVGRIIDCFLCAYAPL